MNHARSFRSTIATTLARFAVCSAPTATALSVTLGMTQTDSRLCWRTCKLHLSVRLRQIGSKQLSESPPSVRPRIGRSLTCWPKLHAEQTCVCKPRQVAGSDRFHHGVSTVARRGQKTDGLGLSEQDLGGVLLVFLHPGDVSIVIPEFGTGGDTDD